MARLLLLLVLVAGAATGCGVRSSAAGDWMNVARDASIVAENARGRGELAGARRALANVARGAAPAGVAPDDARAVRMDAFFRLARLELEDSNPNAARQWAEQGLALGARQDVFTANLYLAEGQALEALGVDLEAQASYHRALVVTEALLGATLAK